MMIILCTCVGAADTCNGQTYDPSSYICTYISGVAPLCVLSTTVRMPARYLFAIVKPCPSITGLLQS